MKSSTPGAVKVVSMKFYRPTRSIRLLQTDRTIYSNIRQIVQYTPLDVGSISTVSRVRSLILPEERWGMSVGSFSRTAAGNRAYTRWPGARFSKLPVITGPVKLFCFPF